LKRHECRAPIRCAATAGVRIRRGDGRCSTAILTPFHGKNVATYFDLWGVNLVDESYRNLFEQDKWNYHK
jgi:hypothetical protein